MGETTSWEGAVNGRMDMIESEATELETRVDDLEDDIGEDRARIEELETKVQQLQAAMLDILKRENAELREKLNIVGASLRKEANE